MSIAREKLLRLVVRAFTVVLVMAMLAPAAMAGSGKRFIVITKAGARHTAARSHVKKMAGRVIVDLPQVNMMAVTSTDPSFAKLALASSDVQAVVPDRVKALIRPGMQRDLYGTTGTHGLTLAPTAVPYHVVNPDPAFNLWGLMWNVYRINAPRYWISSSTGDPAVKVAVADTGIDYTHSEMQGQVENVEDLTVDEDPPICKTYFGVSDADLHAAYGGPTDGDWNGHGSWIAGNIAAALDGIGINGIAPNVKLEALKIAQWCGYAYDSTILAAFTYAADHQYDIVSISFGGYLDRTDPDQEAIYQEYVNTVNYARSKGTLIVSSAGNEHLRIGAGGRVISHGPLTSPGATFQDYYGLWQNPAGVPGVVMVSATGNVVYPTSYWCPAGSTDDQATCKLKFDRHQPFGPGMYDQLAYYSNYGPRVDFAAPGGARKFNLPYWDRGGTPGFPVTVEPYVFDAYEDFSMTSNWATQIPCYLFVAPGIFPEDQCYSTIQGTSMATPHVSAALALIASRMPNLRHKPNQLLQQLRYQTTFPYNLTPPLSANDKSAADLSGAACPTGYCHLGGPAIPSSEAYGNGLVSFQFYP